MDVSPRALLTNFVPQIPSILLIGLLALLGRTDNSPHQDVRTQTIVAAARPILRTPAAIARSQRVWNALGRWSAWFLDVLAHLRLSWLVGFEGIEVTQKTVVVGEELECAVKVDGTTLRDAVAFAFDVLRDPEIESMACPMPDLADVEVEWTKYRPRGKRATSASSCTDRGSGKKSEEDIAPRASSDLSPVILYFHGGAHCLMDPTTHRWTTDTLAKLARADICSVRFRLSPQHPFPAALLDAFVVYLSLVSPSNSTSDQATSARQIVLAGDSSGGSLASSLLLLLLTLSRNNVAILFRNQTIRIPTPPCAGLALTSPWLDVTRSLPSTYHNSRWDIIAPPPIDSASPPFPPDSVWPTHPPRAETYCTSTICTHPLVSPLATKPTHWRGAPPVWVCSGWEGFTDEIEVFARRVYQSSPDANVRFEGWQGMPHCFGMMPWNAAGWEAIYSWADFCSSCARGNVERRDHAIWRVTSGSEKGAHRHVKIDELGCEKVGVGYDREMPLTDDLINQLMEKGRRWRVELEGQMVEQWRTKAGQ